MYTLHSSDTINTDSNSVARQKKNLIKRKKIRHFFRVARFFLPHFLFFSNTHNTNFHIFKKRINEQLLRYKFTTYFLRMDEIFHGESRCKDFLHTAGGNRPVKTNDFAESLARISFLSQKSTILFFFFFSSCDRMLIDSICSSFCGNDCDFRSGPESAVVVIGMNGQIFSFPSFFLSSVMALPRSNDSK